MSFFSAPTARVLAGVLTAALGVSSLGCAFGLDALASRPERVSAALLQTRIDAWLPADVLLLGEQHDAPAHQAVEQQLVETLAARGLLAAVALEMADSGASTTTLQPAASEEQVRQALRWNNDGWPWAAYGPAVMSAVRAGVPVLGANLPRAQMQTSMADAQLDQQLPGPALKTQLQLIRQGHCDLLPESQITPMTRIQIAKDMRMAATLLAAVRPGQVALLISGSMHADKQLGVPQHLPQALNVKAILLKSGPAAAASDDAVFDSVWSTPATPHKDYCADLAQQLPPR